jgi:hypothetical protein
MCSLLLAVVGVVEQTASTQGEVVVAVQFFSNLLP